MKYEDSIYKVGFEECLIMVIDNYHPYYILIKIDMNRLFCFDDDNIQLVLNSVNLVDGTSLLVDEYLVKYYNACKQLEYYNTCKQLEY